MGELRDKLRTGLREYCETPMSLDVLLDALEAIVEEEKSKVVTTLRSVTRSFITVDMLYDVVIHVDGCKVTFQMQEMDESKRGRGLIATRNGYEIVSAYGPAIGSFMSTEKTLFINGNNRESDNRLVEHIFDNSCESCEFYDNFVAMFEELNEEEETQCCGHPKSSIMGDGSTHWCGDCEDCVPVKGFEVKW